MSIENRMKLMLESASKTSYEAELGKAQKTFFKAVAEAMKKVKLPEIVVKEAETWSADDEWRSTPGVYLEFVRGKSWGNVTFECKIARNQYELEVEMKGTIGGDFAEGGAGGDFVVTLETSAADLAERMLLLAIDVSKNYGS